MTRGERLILITICVALAGVVSAVASVNVAIPSIASATRATGTQLQWVVDGYSLAFAGLVLPAGAFGDRIGHRAALIRGLALFGAGAGGAMAVSDPNLLIAARVVMGIGGALTMPSTLSILSVTFTGDARERAITVWAGVAGASGLIGVLLAGGLLELFSWQSAFGLSVVLAAVAIAMTLRFVPADGQETVRLDVVGASLAALGLTGVVWGFIEGPNLGWTAASVIGGFVVGVVLLVAFVWWELRSEHPMLDPRLFALRGFSAGAGSIFVQFFAIYGVIYLALQYFQFVLGYSPLRAGASFAPFAPAVGVASALGSRLVRRLGMRIVAPAGLVLIALGLALSGLGATTDASYWQLLPGVLLLGAGMGLAGPPATSLIIASLPHEKQGVASAVNDTAREVGGALGIAVFGSTLLAYVGHISAHVNLDHFVTGYAAALYIGAGTVLLAAIAIALRSPALITLLVNTGPRAGEKIGLNDPATLGRHADITFEDPELSRRHLAVRPVADGLEVEDLESLNGTYVRGVRISGRVTVRDGADIQVGQTEMTVKLPAPDSGATKVMAVRRPAALADPAALSPLAPAAQADAPSPSPRVASGRSPDPASHAEPVTLLVTSGPRAGERIELTKAVTLGRHGADITIEDAELSARHLALWPVRGGAEIEDLGSTNGTYLRGRPLKGRDKVADGDRIQVGQTTLRVEVGADG